MLKFCFWFAQFRFCFGRDSNHSRSSPWRSTIPRISRPSLRPLLTEADLLSSPDSDSRSTSTMTSSASTTRPTMGGPTTSAVAARTAEGLVGLRKLQILAAVEMWRNFTPNVANKTVSLQRLVSTATIVGHLQRN